MERAELQNELGVAMRRCFQHAVGGEAATVAEGSVMWSVVLNFLGQLDWITGCPGIWLNMISEHVCEGVST